LANTLESVGLPNQLNIVGNEENQILNSFAFTQFTWLLTGQVPEIEGDNYSHEYRLSIQLHGWDRNVDPDCENDPTIEGDTDMTLTSYRLRPITIHQPEDELNLVSLNDTSIYIDVEFEQGSQLETLTLFMRDVTVDSALKTVRLQRDNLPGADIDTTLTVRFDFEVPGVGDGNDHQFAITWEAVTAYPHITDYESEAPTLFNVAVLDQSILSLQAELNTEFPFVRETPPPGQSIIRLTAQVVPVGGGRHDPSPLRVNCNDIDIFFLQDDSELSGWRWEAQDTSIVLQPDEPQVVNINVTYVGECEFEDENPGQVHCEIYWFGVEQFSGLRREGVASVDLEVFDRAVDYVNLSIDANILHIGEENEHFWNFGDSLDVTITFMHQSSLAEPVDSIAILLESPFSETVSTLIEEVISNGTIEWHTRIVFTDPMQQINTIRGGNKIPKRDEVDEHFTTLRSRIVQMRGLYSNDRYHPAIECNYPLILKRRARIKPILSSSDPAPGHIEGDRPVLLLREGAEFNLIVQFKNEGEAEIDPSGANYSVILPNNITPIDWDAQQLLSMPPPDTSDSWRCVATVASDNPETITLLINQLPKDRNNELDVDTVSMESSMSIEVHNRGFREESVLLTINPDNNPMNVSIGQEADLILDGITFTTEIIQHIDIRIDLEDELSLIREDNFIKSFFQSPIQLWKEKIHVSDTLIAADSCEASAGITIVLFYRDDLAEDSLFFRDTISLPPVSFTIHKRPSLYIEGIGLYALNEDNTPRDTTQTVFKLNQPFCLKIKTDATRLDLMNPQDSCSVGIYYPPEWKETVESSSAVEMFDQVEKYSSFKTEFYNRTNTNEALPDTTIIISLSDTVDVGIELTAIGLVNSGELGFRLLDFDRPVDINTGMTIDVTQIEQDLAITVVPLPDVRLKAIPLGETTVIEGDSIFFSLRMENYGAGLFDTLANFRVRDSENVIVPDTVTAQLNRTTRHSVETTVVNKSLNTIISFELISPLRDSLSYEQVDFVETDTLPERVLDFPPIPDLALKLSLQDAASGHFRSSVEVQNDHAEASVGMKFSTQNYYYFLDGRQLDGDEYKIKNSIGDNYCQVDPGGSAMFYQDIQLIEPFNVRRGYLQTKLDENAYIYRRFGQDNLDSNRVAKPVSDSIKVSSPYPLFLQEYGNFNGWIEPDEQVGLVFSEPMLNSITVLVDVLARYPLFVNDASGSYSIWVIPDSLKWDSYKDEPNRELKTYIALSTFRNVEQIAGIYNGLVVDSLQPPLLTIDGRITNDYFRSASGIPYLRISEIDTSIDHFPIIQANDLTPPSVNDSLVRYIKDDKIVVELLIQDDGNEIEHRSGVDSSGISLFTDPENPSMEWHFEPYLAQDLFNYQRYNLTVTFNIADYDTSTIIYLTVIDRANNIYEHEQYVGPIRPLQYPSEQMFLYPSPYDITADDKRLFIQFEAYSNNFNIAMTDLNARPILFFFHNGECDPTWVAPNEHPYKHFGDNLGPHRHLINVGDRFSRLPNGIYPVILYDNGGHNDRYIFSIMKGGVTKWK